MPLFFDLKNQNPGSTVQGFDSDHLNHKATSKSLIVTGNAG